MRPFRKGDRVTRELYMDDGTWRERGDSCLPESPIRHGTVIDTVAARDRSGKPLVQVRWDETGEELWYLPHGLTFASE